MPAEIINNYFGKQSFRTGIYFGLGSGIIAVLGLIVGFYSATGSVSIIIGGILFIAVADGFADSLGIHISQESDKRKTQKQIWEATLSAFFSQFFVGLTFIIPFLLFPLNIALLINVSWGIFLLIILSFCLAKIQKENFYKVVLEHLLVVGFVIFVTYLIGNWIGGWQ